MFNSTPGTSVSTGVRTGLIGTFGLRGELAVPECVEIVGTRRREPDLRRRDGGADRVESVVAAGVASDVTGSLRGGSVRLDRDVDHLRLVARDFDLVLARGKIELAFFENHRVVAPNRPLVGVGGRDRTGRHRPADGFADIVDAAGVIWRKGELLRDRRTLSQRRGGAAAVAPPNRTVKALQRLIVRVEKPRAEVGGSAAVDDGRAHDVRPFLSVRRLETPSSMTVWRSP